MTAPSTQLAEIQAKLRALHTKQADTFEELTRSIAIKEIWPDAFESGAVSIRPSYTQPKRFGAKRNHVELIDITITRLGSNGVSAPNDSRVFAAADLPPVLFDHFKQPKEKPRNGHN